MGLWISHVEFWREIFPPFSLAVSRRIWPGEGERLNCHITDQSILPTNQFLLLRVKGFLGLLGSFGSHVSCTVWPSQLTQPLRSLRRSTPHPPPYLCLFICLYYIWVKSLNRWVDLSVLVNGWVRVNDWIPYVWFNSFGIFDIEMGLICVQKSGEKRHYKVEVRGRNPSIWPRISAADSMMNFSNGKICCVKIP